MQDKPMVPVSRQALQRMPYYLQILKEARSAGTRIISAPTIAARLSLNEVQVRKDLAAVSTESGRPKTGFEVIPLIRSIEAFLGCNNVNDAVLVGAGSLGRALLSYRGFADYGLSIVAAFDADPALIGGEIAGKPVYALDRLGEVCRSGNIRIGVITVPASQAQGVCDRLVDSGALAIWNFAPVHLVTPEGILVQNENMAASLAVLSQHLAERLGGGDAD